MKSLARARSMRFEWQKLVTPLTPKAAVAEWQSRDGEISSKMMTAASISKTVEPIDWSYWSEAISTPGVVDELKAEYEALQFPTVNAYTAETNAKIAGIEEEILNAKKQAVLGADELKEVDKVIETINKLKTDGLTWSMEQWHAFLPGLEAQHKAEYEDENYLVSDDQLKSDSIDWSAAGKEFKEGLNPDLGPVPESVGDFNTSEEIALVKEGKWSVARVFASKEERAKIHERIEAKLATVA